MNIWVISFSDMSLSIFMVFSIKVGKIFRIALDARCPRNEAERNEVVHRATQREPQTIATEFRMKRSRAERNEWISSQRYAYLKFGVA